jgi:hypothetical protein
MSRRRNSRVVRARHRYAPGRLMATPARPSAGRRAPGQPCAGRWGLDSRLFCVCLWVARVGVGGSRIAVITGGTDGGRTYAAPRDVRTRCWPVLVGASGHSECAVGSGGGAYAGRLLRSPDLARPLRRRRRHRPTLGAAGPQLPAQLGHDLPPLRTHAKRIDQLVEAASAELAATPTVPQRARPPDQN